MQHVKHDIGYILKYNYLTNLDCPITHNVVSLKLHSFKISEEKLASFWQVSYPCHSGCGVKPCKQNKTKQKQLVKIVTNNINVSNIGGSLNTQMVQVTAKNYFMEVKISSFHSLVTRRVTSTADLQQLPLCGKLFCCECNVLAYWVLIHYKCNNPVLSF